MTKKLSHRFMVMMALAAFATCAWAQQSSGNWANNMREAKHNFIVEETGMTQAQKEKFLPLYEAMEKEIYQTNKSARSMESKITNGKGSISDSEYEQAADALSNVKVREAQIEEKYYDKFSKILNKKQMFQLKRAETRFTRKMLTSSNSTKSTGKSKK